MENYQSQQSQEIDLKTVDWNTLTPEDFSKLSEKFSERNKVIKEKKNTERKKRTAVKMVPVKIDGKSYEIPSTMLERLKNLNDGKPKEKLIEEIKENYPLIEEL